MIIQYIAKILFGKTRSRSYGTLFHAFLRYDILNVLDNVIVCWVHLSHPFPHLCMLALTSPLRYTSLTGVAAPSTEERRLTMLEFDEETHQALMDACLDDSTKIIRYMEEKEKQSRPYNLTMLILALISAIGGTVAAITGVMTYLSQLS